MHLSSSQAVDLNEVAWLERKSEKAILPPKHGLDLVPLEGRHHSRLEPIIPDVLCEGLDLVFCGTAPSKVSAASGAYYAHPGNAFWRMIHEAGLTTRKLAAQEFRRLLQYRIGLTDLAKFHYGNDSELPAGAFDIPAFRDRILRIRPRWVAFTSKTAAQAYAGRSLQFGLQSWCIGSTNVFILPSPSGQARRTWNPALWHELVAQVRSSVP